MPVSMKGTSMTRYYEKERFSQLRNFRIRAFFATGGTIGCTGSDTERERCGATGKQQPRHSKIGYAGSRTEKETARSIMIDTAPAPTAQLSPEALAQVRIFQQNEVTESEVYRRIAAGTKDESNRAALLRIADE